MSSAAAKFGSLPAPGDYRAAIRKLTRSDFQTFKAALLAGEQPAATRQEIAEQRDLRIQQLLNEKVLVAVETT